jgi:hypothetical protein
MFKITNYQLPITNFKLLGSLIAFTLALTLVLSPAAALAQGLDFVEPPQGTAQGNLVDAVIFILNGLLIVAALAAVVFIIIGGIQFIFSQGNEDQAATAKNTILFAVIGLIVIGLAAALVNFVVQAIQSA